MRLAPLTTDLEPGPEYVGRDGIARWLRELAQSDRDFQPAITGMEDHGSRVLVTGCVYVAGSGPKLEQAEAAWVFEFDAQARLSRMRAYRDVEAARTAAVAD